MTTQREIATGTQSVPVAMESTAGLLIASACGSVAAGLKRIILRKNRF